MCEMWNMFKVIYVNPIIENLHRLMIFGGTSFKGEKKIYVAIATQIIFLD